MIWIGIIMVHDDSGQGGMLPQMYACLKSILEKHVPNFYPAEGEFVIWINIYCVIAFNNNVFMTATAPSSQPAEGRI